MNTTSSIFSFWKVIVVELENLILLRKLVNFLSFTCKFLCILIQFDKVQQQLNITDIPHTHA